MPCLPNKFPFLALTLNLAQVSEGGRCLCIVGCAGLYLLSISIFTFLRLVTVLMKGCCKQTRGRRLCGHTAVTAMWSPAWCVCAAALARSIHKYVLSSCCMPGIGSLWETAVKLKPRPPGEGSMLGFFPKVGPMALGQ